MKDNQFGGFVFIAFMLTVVVLLVFGLLQWLEVPTGQMIDWVVGIASFWWLLVIVTLPWDIYSVYQKCLMVNNIRKDQP